MGPMVKASFYRSDADRASDVICVKGEVERVGADSQVTSDGTSYFPVVTRIDVSEAKRLGMNGIIPGMTADISIVTGAALLLRRFCRISSRMKPC